MAETDGGAIEAVGAAGDGPGARRMELTDMTREASQEAIAAGNLSSVMESAMSGITVMPGTASEPLAFKDEITGEVGGDVVREKTGLMSNGADGGADTDQEKMDALTARYERLYTDMTVFQVAWSIARRVQQDTSQLLRGQ